MWGKTQDQFIGEKRVERGAEDEELLASVWGHSFGGAYVEADEDAREGVRIYPLTL